AFDYLNKPLNVEDLLNTVKRAIKNPQSTLHVTNDNVEGLELIGRSRLMLDLFKTIGKVSPSDSTVFILGESGTGKELIARQIHKLSKRASRPFVAINCGALTESLLEAELFGHQKGAFTGATGDRKGLFMEASGGTIFLDEITETTTVFQMKLLRVLQEGEILPVGSSISRKVDVRVIAATNRNIDTLVQEKQFRTDLLYRLRVITLRLPSLKERQEDIPLLINHFIRKYTPKNSLLPIVSTEALKKLLSHDWPGNVRELEHAIESAVVLRSSSLIKVEDLPENIRRPTTTVSKEQEPTALISLAEVEYRHTKRVLEAMGGNKSQAARILGIDRKTLDRILQRSGSFEKFY
ncbi:MAG: sigma-54-dependent Fis family transcriptional regulator, partial [Blastocatellia bacterium]|nr:sigma-54-dependent Fis family transcriptional regulator [Blastocatellia bacterium]